MPLKIHFQYHYKSTQLTLNPMPNSEILSDFLFCSTPSLIEDDTSVVQSAFLSKHILSFYFPVLCTELCHFMACQLYAFSHSIPSLWNAPSPLFSELSFRTQISYCVL